MHLGEHFGPANVSGTSVPAATSVTTLLAANGNRLGAAFYNYSEATLFLKLGGAASSNDFTVKLGSGSYYEMPILPLYTGSITGVWVSATGSVKVSQYTIIG